MFHILLFLTYTRIEFKEQSYSFFKKRSQLEYGFNKDATFTFRFSNVTSDMVFGLATHEEMEEIDVKGDLPSYCKGLYNLSKIQYSIKNDTEIHGRIPTKSILTPYFYICRSKINVIVDLEFCNGENHLDYRFQLLPLFIIIYLALTAAYIACFTVLSICLQKRIPNGKNNYILIGLLLSIFVQDVDALLLLNMEKNREYIQNIFFDAYDYHIKYKYDLISLFSIVASLAFVHAYAYRSFLDDREKKKCTSQCCRVALLVVPIVCIVGVLPLMVSFHTSDDIRFALFAGVFMLVFIAAFLMMPPPLSLVKAGLAIYLLDALISSPVAYMVMHTVYSHSPVVTPIFAFIVMFVTLQALSMIFLMFAFHRSRAGTAVDDSPLLRTVKLKDSENDDSQQNRV